MKIKTAEFLTIAGSMETLPPERYPEIALAGRSNVGKSSFLNTLAGRKNLAKTSGTPGKTRAIHYYLINGLFYFVDLPGYGYAQVSKAMKDKWAVLLEQFFTTRETLTMIIQLVDLRHEPSKEDIQMAEWIRHFAFPHIIVATKADKIPRGRRQKNRQTIAAALDAAPAAPICFSAITGEGKDEVLQTIEKVII